MTDMHQSPTCGIMIILFLFMNPSFNRPHSWHYTKSNGLNRTQFRLQGFDIFHFFETQYRERTERTASPAKHLILSERPLEIKGWTAMESRGERPSNLGVNGHKIKSVNSPPLKVLKWDFFHWTDTLAVYIARLK